MKKQIHQGHGSSAAVQVTARMCGNWQVQCWMEQDVPFNEQRSPVTIHAQFSFTQQTIYWLVLMAMLHWQEKMHRMQWYHAGTEAMVVVVELRWETAYPWINDPMAISCWSINHSRFQAPGFPLICSGPQASRIAAAMLNGRKWRHVDQNVS